MTSLQSLLTMVLPLVLGLSSCSADTTQAQRNISQIRIGDSKERVMALLGEPTSTDEACGSIDLPDKARERATRGCGRSWHYGSIIHEKFEVLIEPDGRVGSIIVFGDRPDWMPVPAPVGAPVDVKPYNDDDYLLYPVRAAAVNFVDEYNQAHNTHWEALAPRCADPLETSWVLPERGLSGPAVEVSCPRTASGTTLTHWRLYVPVAPAPPQKYGL